MKTKLQENKSFTSVTAGKMGLYGAGTGIDNSYVDSGPEISLELTK